MYALQCDHSVCCVLCDCDSKLVVFLPNDINLCSQDWAFPVRLEMEVCFLNKPQVSFRKAIANLRIAERTLFLIWIVLRHGVPVAVGELVLVTEMV